MSSLADLPELVGFFSYSREDDEGAFGALSALRERIQRELRAQLGRTAKTFRIWQDKEAIPSGTLWESEIKNSVAQAVFFIPIITPTVVASPYCRFELDAFLVREAELGRSDLVFPILYIHVPALDDGVRRQNDAVLSFIAKRQYVDWREFRHLDSNSTEVKRAVERFCQDIRDALSKSWVSPEERKQQEEAAARDRVEAERQRQGAEAKRRAEKEAEQRTADEERRKREAEAELNRIAQLEAKAREEEVRRRRQAEVEQRRAEAERRRADERRLREEAEAKRRAEGEERSQQRESELRRRAEGIQQRATRLYNSFGASPLHLLAWIIGAAGLGSFGLGLWTLATLSDVLTSYEWQEATGPLIGCGAAGSVGAAVLIGLTTPRLFVRRGIGYACCFTGIAILGFAIWEISGISNADTIAELVFSNPESIVHWQDIQFTYLTVGNQLLVSGIAALAGGAVLVGLAAARPTVPYLVAYISGVLGITFLTWGGIVEPVAYLGERRLPIFAVAAYNSGFALLLGGGVLISLATSRRLVGLLFAGIAVLAGIALLAIWYWAEDLTFAREAREQAVATMGVMALLSGVAALVPRATERLSG
jgi:TIR domain-containing protein